MKWMKKTSVLLLLAIVLVLQACSGADDAEEENEGESVDEQAEGGVLEVALDAQPPSLDPPISSAIATRDTSRLVFETLMTTDESFQPTPMLAESVDTDDNKLFTFKLREGVTFHNGDELQAEDVIASMERWQDVSPLTGNIFDDAEWREVDEYTVELELVEPSSLTLDTISSVKHAAAIMPKEIVESAEVDGVDEYIGTGPYKFVEWKQDQVISFERYDDYVGMDSEQDGLAGEKQALFDEINFHIVSDVSTRLAGLQSGEYDFAFGIHYDSYDQLENDDELQSILDINGVQVMKYNLMEGIAADPKFREAINLALDIDEIMEASFPNEDLYWLHSGYMDEDLVNWQSDAGEEYFNVNDPEKVKEILDEIGYDGEEFRIMATRDYEHFYNGAVVIQDQLKEIGVNAELEIYDWPTMFDKFDDVEDYDAFMVSFSVASTPPQFLALSPTWGGGFEDDHAVELMAKVETAPTLEEAKEYWDELQLYSWEELLPVTNFGSFHNLYGASNNLEGITTFSGPVFWNASFKE